MPALSPTSSNQQRQPPPSLFLGPPSRDSSHASLPSLLAQNAPTSSGSQRGPLARQRSIRNIQPARLEGTSGGLDPAGPSLLSPSSPLNRKIPQQQQHHQKEIHDQRQADRTDALWAEMQSTLEEVELSAANGPHVFGADHSKALEELRTAQIALAQAWARSEVDEASDTAAERDDTKVSKGASLLASEDAIGGGVASSSTSGLNQGGIGGGKGNIGSKLEEETENDILLARKRREANDRYFQRVNGGVLDVVAKLEEVAVAMRDVEREIRDIWSDTSESTEIST
ncbi:MAG: hypothetical protein M1837_004721 [Sclerophora amabilis]|nr:MAG: hypothetical protein M1837_004721 [Sclerophora amabilis]